MLALVRMFSITVTGKEMKTEVDPLEWGHWYDKLDCVVVRPLEMAFKMNVEKSGIWG